MAKGPLIELTDLIEFASAQAEKIFRKTCVIHPMYHAICASGETMILPAMHQDKDLSVAMTKAWFALNDVDRYVFMDEAWIVSDREGKLGLDIEKARRYGISNHPERREIVLFSAENRKGEKRTANRYILRPEHGKPTLSPLTIDEPFDHSEGRMVGLLDWNKESK